MDGWMIGIKTRENPASPFRAYLQGGNATSGIACEIQGRPPIIVLQGQELMWQVPERGAGCRNFRSWRLPISMGCGWGSCGEAVQD